MEERQKPNDEQSLLQLAGSLLQHRWRIARWMMYGVSALQCHGSKSQQAGALTARLIGAARTRSACCGGANQTAQRPHCPMARSFARLVGLWC